MSTEQQAVNSTAQNIPAWERPDHEIFQVLIDGKMIPVYQRQEKHKLAERNQGPDCWWLKVGDKFVPYLDKFVHRRAFGFKIQERNYSKHKWGDMQLHSQVLAEITCQEQVIYEFICHDTAYALARCQQLRVLMDEHVFEFHDIPSNFGRKVWYYRQPAILEQYYDRGRIALRHENGVFDLSTPWNTPSEDDDWNLEKVVHTDVLDENIYWFRD